MTTFRGIFDAAQQGELQAEARRVQADRAAREALRARREAATCSPMSRSALQLVAEVQPGAVAGETPIQVENTPHEPQEVRHAPAEGCFPPPPTGPVGP